MSSEQANETQVSSCVACLEPIRNGARTCPHCGASQLPQRWHNFSEVLKWIGGIVTIVSLVGGLITLSQFYLDWRERHDAVSEIVAAADWLIRSENYQQAWDMYHQAAELNPSSAEVRDGRFRLALKWLRNFSVAKERTDETLTRLTEILYRGLPDADAEQGASILAHIGYIQALRKINRLPIYTDVEALFEQAFAASETNVYANAMYARWLTLVQPMTVEQLDRAQQYFERAISSGQEREYIRRLQFYGFANYSYAKPDELEVNALSKLIRICIDMRANGEGYPDEDTRYRIRDGYGNTGRADHVEALIAVLPAEAHLDVYEWLLAADDDSREDMQHQSSYIRARLNEEIGALDNAIALYRQLLEAQTKDELAALVDRGIERLTGKLPERALARKYFSDPVPTANVWEFHAETIAKFDPKWLPVNFDQALEYFHNYFAQSPERIPALTELIATNLKRIFNLVLEGDEIERRNFYTMNFNKGDHDRIRFNFIRLSILYSRILTNEKNFHKGFYSVGNTQGYSAPSQNPL